MNEEITQAPLQNGAAHELPLVPVIGTEPVVKPKRKRRTKAQMAAARAKAEREARAKRPEPKEHQVSTASAATAETPESPRPIEDASPASSVARGAGALLTPRTNPDDPAVRLSTTMAAFLIVAAVGAIAGIFMAVA
jgi:hypothetical protein